MILPLLTVGTYTDSSADGLTNRTGPPGRDFGTRQPRYFCGSSASGRLAVRGAAVGHAIVKGGRVHGALKVAVGGVWTYDLRSKAVGLPDCRNWDEYTL